MKNGPKTTGAIISISAIVLIFGLRLLLDGQKDLAVTKPRSAEDDRSLENTSASAAMDRAGHASQFGSALSGDARDREGLSHRTGTGGFTGSGKKKKEEKPSAVDLTGLTTNAEKIAKILASVGEEKQFSPGDPRLEQLKALGDPAVNDLLDAYDTVTTLDTDDKTKLVKECLLKDALVSMLGPDDKEIILTYFREKADFSELVSKYRFPEAGIIAFQRLGQKLANPERPWFLDYISAVAKHAPAVDLRPALRQTIKAARTRISRPIWTTGPDWPWSGACPKDSMPPLRCFAIRNPRTRSSLRSKSSGITFLSGDRPRRQRTGSRKTGQR